MNINVKVQHFVEKYGSRFGVTEDDFSVPPVTQADRTEAQALFTALMTDTLLEE